MSRRKLDRLILIVFGVVVVLCIAIALSYDAFAPDEPEPYEAETSSRF